MGTIIHVLTPALLSNDRIRSMSVTARIPSHSPNHCRTYSMATQRRRGCDTSGAHMILVRRVFTSVTSEKMVAIPVGVSIMRKRPSSSVGRVHWVLVKRNDDFSWEHRAVPADSGSIRARQCAHNPPCRTTYPGAILAHHLCIAHAHAHFCHLHKTCALLTKTHCTCEWCCVLPRHGHGGLLLIPTEHPSPLALNAGPTNASRTAPTTPARCTPAAALTVWALDD
jgi:hypothetical protein